MGDGLAMSEVTQSPNHRQRHSVVPSNALASERIVLQPWDREGEFEVHAVILGQSKGELTVRVPDPEKTCYLTICGFLPGRVNGQLWRLECIRESGCIELLDGERVKA